MMSRLILQKCVGSIASNKSTCPGQVYGKKTMPSNSEAVIESHCGLYNRKDLDYIGTYKKNKSNF